MQCFEGIVNISGLQTLSISGKYLIVDFFNCSLQHVEGPFDGSSPLNRFKKMVIFIERFLPANF